MNVLLPFHGSWPQVGARLDAAPSARIIGRTTLGPGCVLRPYATIRGDGETIDVGGECWFGEHSTVHIVHGLIPTRIGSRVTVGRRALVHAVTVGDGVVLGEGAVLLDGAEIGPGAAVAAGALVPARKRLAGGVLYAGVPAFAVRPLAPGELEAMRSAARGLEAAASPSEAEGRPPARLALSAGALVCDTVHVEGAVSLGAGANVWFGTRIVAGRGAVAIGARSNVQDNSTLAVEDDGAIHVGDRVTIGHNVTLEACRIMDGALVGNGSRVSRGTVVEAGACVAASAVTPPGAVVEAGMLWAGRPARALRPLTSEERQAFDTIPGIYGDEYRPRYLAAMAGVDRSP